VAVGRVLGYLMGQGETEQESSAVSGRRALGRDESKDLLERRGMRDGEGRRRFTGDF
jgi:hypothetical protein